MSGLNGTPMNHDVNVHDDNVNANDNADTSTDAPAHDDVSERLRLEGEIAAAKARAVAARERAAALDAQIEADSRSELVLARQTVEEMERDHAVTVTRLRHDAQAQAAEIVAEARLQAARLRHVSKDPAASQAPDA